MKKLETMNKMSRAFGNVGLQIKKHSPEILVVSGVVGVVASAVLACRATVKATSIVKESKETINQINDLYDHPEEVQEEVTEEDRKRDLTIVKTKTGLQLVKTYAPSVALGALSITCIFAGNNILHKRNIALAAAYTTIDSSFKNYRKNVIDRFGEELDKELKYNLKAQEIEETEIDENGKEKKVKKTVNVIDTVNDLSGYARIFDDGNIGWQKDAGYNLWFLKQQQAYANDKLKANGHIFLNEVYDMLGYPRTSYGQQVGWRYDEKHPTGDNYVDFGIYQVRNKRFVEGVERVAILDFNVDGPILNLI